MTSSSTQRTSNGTTMAGTTRPSRFPNLAPNPTSNGANGTEKGTQSITNKFPAPGAWGSSNSIWSSNPSTIGNGFVNNRESVGVRDSNDGFAVNPSGSGTLASTSEVDTWGRPSGPWNSSDNSQTRNVSGQTSPNRTRSEVALHDMPGNMGYYSGQQTMTQRALGGPKDTKNGSFKYPSQFADFTDDQDNSFGNLNGEPEQTLGRFPTQRSMQEQTFLGNGHSRDHMSTSGHSDNDLHGQGNSFSEYPYGTHPTTIHSQRPSLNGPSGSFHGQNSRSYDHGIGQQMADDEVTERLGRMAIGSGLNGGSNGLGFGNGAQDFQLNPGSQPWDNGQGYQGGHSRDNYSNSISLDRRGSGVDRSSPAGSTYRAGGAAVVGLNSPRSITETPQPGIDSWSRPVSRDLRSGPDVDRRSLSHVFPPQQSPYYQNGYYSNYPQFAPGPYESIYGRQAVQFPGYQLPQYPFAPNGVPPVRPSSDRDPARGVRSFKLEEFKTGNKSSKRFELKDIYGYIVEFSGDQHGSRFIQNKLETANSDDKNQVFQEIEPNAIVLMKDLFGNYVIQKFFEHGNQAQKQVLAAAMKGKVVELSMQMYACRVVQKALSHVLVEQQAELVKELEPEILTIVKDQNGNHVVQKIIQTVPRQHIGFIFDCFKGRVSELSSHSYGCRVIQRALEHGNEADKQSIMKELHSCAQMLIMDQYGNYVTQHVIIDGSPDDRSKMVALVMSQLPIFSKHKFASNVVEKCIKHGTPDQQRDIRDRFMSRADDGNSFLVSLIKDQFGNYVLQTLLSELQGQDRDALVNEVRPLLASIKKMCTGKQIAGVDRLHNAISSITPSSTAPTSPGLHVDVNSAVPTPNLTMGPNSPSSSPPSTNESSVEEAIGQPDAKPTTTDATVNIQDQADEV
ncbi:putative pumilio protein [Triangularia verruculosa]|uniref:Pumilio homology domain family member 3 n=1 Tax=Triangularia verruculosa TaxID=2587418 RepID=A0AAN6XA06_9PEZI|nr:putative pumilio protein [Triangularia verruculosa]